MGPLWALSLGTWIVSIGYGPTVIEARQLRIITEEERSEMKNMRYECGGKAYQPRPYLIGPDIRASESGGDGFGHLHNDRQPRFRRFFGNGGSFPSKTIVLHSSILNRSHSIRLITYLRTIIIGYVKILQYGIHFLTKKYIYFI